MAEELREQVPVMKAGAAGHGCPDDGASQDMEADDILGTHCPSARKKQGMDVSPGFRGRGSACSWRADHTRIRIPKTKRRAVRRSRIITPRDVGGKVSA